MNDADEQYQDLLKAERRAKREFKLNGYRPSEACCCAACSHSYQGTVDDPRICTLVAQDDKWTYVAEVDDLGICNLFKGGSP